MRSHKPFIAILLAHLKIIWECSPLISTGADRCYGGDCSVKKLVDEGDIKTDLIPDLQFDCMVRYANIWSVGCTVIEMATGKPPWSQQFQEHPFVVEDHRELHPLVRSSALGDYSNQYSAVRSSAAVKYQGQEPNHLVRSSALVKYQDPNTLVRSSSIRAFALERSVNFLCQSTSLIRSSFDINNILSTARSIQYMPNIGSVRDSIRRSFSVRQSTAKDL